MNLRWFNDLTVFHASGLFVKMSSIPVESLSNQAPKFPSLLLRCNSVLILPYTIGVSTPWGTTTTPTSEELSKVNSSARVNHSVEIPVFQFQLHHMKVRKDPNICESWDLMPEPHFWFRCFFCCIFFATGLRWPLEVLLSWFSREKFRSSIGARSARGGYPARDG